MSALLCTGNQSSTWDITVVTLSTLILTGSLAISYGDHKSDQCGSSVRSSSSTFAHSIFEVSPSKRGGEPWTPL